MSKSFIKIFIISFLILVGMFAGTLLLAIRVADKVPEPRFLTRAPKNKTYSKAERMKYDGLSHSSAGLGWDWLKSYYNKNSFVPAVNRSYVGYAMRAFNYCWSFNHKNYQAYWGAGVVRGIQATWDRNHSIAEKYLKQSVEFILMALKRDVPDKQLNNVRMDLANAYNGLGSLYKEKGKAKLSVENLKKAREILLDITQKEPQNGRAFYLLALNTFFEEKYLKAENLIKQALNKKFKVPEDFIKEVKSHIPEDKSIL